MRIAFVSENLDVSYGGPAKSIPHLVGRLRHFVDGIEIFVIKSKKSGLKNELLSRFKIDYQVHNTDIGGKIGYSRTFQKALINYIQKDDHAVVHVNNLWRWGPLWGLYIANKMKRKTVLSARGMLLDSAVSKHKILKKILWHLLFRSVVQKVDCIHVTSLAEAQSIKGYNLRPPIAFVPHGFDSFKGTSESDKLLAKQELDLPRERNFVLFLSRISEHKGLHILIEAFAEISKKFHDFDLLVAGEYNEQAYEERIKNLITRYRLEGRVRFLGQVEGKKKEFVYSAANVFALPSRSENFGLVVGEALSFGLPVIASHGTPWAILSDENIGAWIPRKIEDFERELIKFCSMTPEMLNSIQPRIQRILSKYSWEQSGRDMNDLYKWLFDQTRNPEFILK